MLTLDFLIDEIAASSKKQVLEMLAVAASKVFYAAPESVLAALVERERLGSTAIGGGAAIPHLKVSGLKAMHGIFARLKTAVDYDASDKQPVDLIFLLLVPEGGGGTVAPLTVLAYVARFLGNAETRSRLRSGDKAGVMTIINNWLQRHMV